jgi:hypothetical protein
MTLGDFLEKSTEKEFIREFSSRTYLRYFSFVLSERGADLFSFSGRRCSQGKSGQCRGKYSGFTQKRVDKNRKERHNIGPIWDQMAGKIPRKACLFFFREVRIPGPLREACWFPARGRAKS